MVNRVIHSLLIMPLWSHRDRCDTRYDYGEMSLGEGKGVTVGEMEGEMREKQGERDKGKATY